MTKWKGPLCGLLGLFWTGCFPTPTFWCHEDALCEGIGGIYHQRCLYDGRYGRHCAIPASQCASGYQWHEDAGPSLANTCVDPSMLPMDGGPPDASRSDGGG